MKIIVWGINYAPEKTGIAPYNTGMCEFLKARGHDVRMLTTFSYYPEWEKAPEDGGRLYRTDEANGVPVHRCWHYVPRRPTALKRMIHEGTFVLTSFLRALFLPRADLVIVVLPPLLLGAAAWLLQLFKRSPYIVHVQDMQPDAAIMLGMLKQGTLSRILYAFERFAYKRAAVVSGITNGMLRMFAEKGVEPDRRLLFPNWAPETAELTESCGAFRRKYDIPPDAFLAVYSGNLGKKQGLEVILDAANLIETAANDTATTIRFVIAGDGVEKPALAARIDKEGLRSIMLLPLLPSNDYLQMLLDADACLVTQQRGSGALFFPSKLLSILPRARPVIATADPGGELEHAITEGNFGWFAQPDDGHALAKIVCQVAESPSAVQSCGDNGKQWVEKFERVRVLEGFEAEMVRRFS